jgi:hypothetical protein
MSKDKAPIVILNASKLPFLSIGVKFGGITTYGVKYNYILETDSYVQSLYMKELQSRKWDKFMEYIKTIKND